MWLCEAWWLHTSTRLKCCLNGVVAGWFWFAIADDVDVALCGYLTVILWSRSDVLAAATVGWLDWTAITSSWLDMTAFTQPRTTLDDAADEGDVMRPRTRSMLLMLESRLWDVLWPPPPPPPAQLTISFGLNCLWWLMNSHSRDIHVSFFMSCALLPSHSIYFNIWDVIFISFKIDLKNSFFWEKIILGLLFEHSKIGLFNQKFCQLFLLLLNFTIFLFNFG